MVKLIILRGLPGSGKTTWAKQYVAAQSTGHPWTIVSLDDLRLMFAGTWENRDRILASKRRKEFTQLVVKTSRHTIADLLDAGWNVIADAQHAQPEFASELALLAVKHHAVWETKDFDQPLETLLERNAQRTGGAYVDPEYIRSQYERCHANMFQPVSLPNPNGNLLERMQADPDVRVNAVAGETDLFACNFTRDAFAGGRWTHRTLNARGLFLDHTGRVIMRGFEKFFAVDEKGETSRENVLNHNAYPVRVESKENGFLGLVGAADKPGEFRFFSKSGATDYSKLVEHFFPKEPAVREGLWNILHDNNVTALFEAIVPDSDRHIIHYDEPELCFIHLVRNQEKFQIADQQVQERFAEIGGFHRPSAYVCNSREELEHAIDQAFNSEREGVVLYFNDGWMVKVKSNRYRRIKSLRPMLQRALLRGKPVQGDARKVLDYANRHGIDLTWQPQGFSRDVDMTKVGLILDALDSAEQVSNEKKGA
ncbi:RNA ligase [Bifidobacterium callitrichidarum]|uniref:Kinase n=1 Tax=Bifidobacterium callitrichidarum TaxID=2052941 RepID=A0A2U2N957_9BIFI|nr:RNA ligase [Bifidobacterium callitrichidarum]PWG65633.1 kinase [Bifidobacterium callitrichidarum]